MLWSSWSVRWRRWQKRCGLRGAAGVPDSKPPGLPRGCPKRCPKRCPKQALPQASAAGQVQTCRRSWTTLTALPLPPPPPCVPAGQPETAARSSGGQRSPGLPSHRPDLLVGRSRCPRARPGGRRRRRDHPDRVRAWGDRALAGTGVMAWCCWAAAGRRRRGRPPHAHPLLLLLPPCRPALHAGPRRRSCPRRLPRWGWRGARACSSRLPAPCCRPTRQPPTFSRRRARCAARPARVAASRLAAVRLPPAPCPHHTRVSTPTRCA